MWEQRREWKPLTQPVTSALLGLAQTLQDSFSQKPLSYWSLFFLKSLFFEEQGWRGATISVWIGVKCSSTPLFLEIVKGKGLIPDQTSMLWLSMPGDRHRPPHHHPLFGFSHYWRNVVASVLIRAVQWDLRNTTEDKENLAATGALWLAAVQ